MNMGHAEIAEIYRNLQEDVPPLLRWEVFPSQHAPIYTAESNLPLFCKWGFDGPHGKQLLINARAETVAEKPFFAKDFVRNRCAIPCSGFFEWDDDKNKILFDRSDGGALYLGGFCKTQDERRFVILTKPATANAGRVHSRMPLLLNKTDVANFLYDGEFAKNFIRLPNEIDLRQTPCR